MAKGVTKYNGIRDASAAVALDHHHFVVANDERDTLVIYRFGQPDPVDRLKLSKYLRDNGVNGKAREADLEGSARVEDLIYWIASHGRDAEGRRQGHRLRFFATKVRNGRPEVPENGVYKDLLRDMLEDEALAFLNLEAAVGGLEEGSLGPAPEDPNGFNIEGLAARPDGALLIGFRNPRPMGKGLILPLLNPLEVVSHHARAQFGRPALLDLGGHGIRSLENVQGGYVLIAGPYGKTDPNPVFALYTWSGGDTAAAIRLPFEVGAMHPEAVFARGHGPALQVLMDDGDQHDGPPRFRATEVILPDHL
jgi:hypothetical protein